MEAIPFTPRLGRRAARRLLNQHFPECFAGVGEDKRPLAFGVHREAAARLTGIVPAEAVARAIADYCSGPTYLRNIVCGAHRIHLDGSIVGGCTQWDEDDAARKLRRMGISHAQLQVSAMEAA